MKTLNLPYPRIGLVLQGGGALGSYQAGVLEGLDKRGIYPTWVGGISIGSLNCAVIAGNAPKDRVEKLKGFWETICRNPSPLAQLLIFADKMYAGSQMGTHMFDSTNATNIEKMFGSAAASNAIMGGQQNFFVPKHFAPGVGTPADVSFYDTSPMLATLEKFCDFDRINDHKSMRVSVGATNIRTGNFVYFDNTQMKLEAKHFLASGSLPPGFPAVEIDGEFYWDGGCVSNTPLEHFYSLGNVSQEDTLVFQIDLWSAAGELPTNIFEVMERQKDIQYSSRTRSGTNAIKEKQKLRRLLSDTLDRVPDSVKSQDPWFAELKRESYARAVNYIQLIYQDKPSEGHFKDYQFSFETMQMHWQAGLEDILETLSNPKCLELPPDGENYAEYDFHRAHKTDHTLNRRKK
jgi:NTE family protein